MAGAHMKKRKGSSNKEVCKFLQAFNSSFPLSTPVKFCLISPHPVRVDTDWKINKTCKKLSKNKNCLKGPPYCMYLLFASLFFNLQHLKMRLK